MKNKLLLKAMAVILSAACLSGCSQTPATENTSSETETEVETTTTTTEASVEETESSTTESEEIVDIDITKTAAAYGMTETEDFKAAMEMRNAGTLFCYVSEDAENASSTAEIYMVHIAPSVEFDLDRFVYCSENYPISSDGLPASVDTPNAFTYAYQMDAKDSASAKEIYAVGAEWISHLSSYGEVKNGDNYTIAYSAVDNGDILVVEMYGLYVSGNTVIWIESWTNTVNNDACIDFFCKDLGLESPTTLKK